MKWLKNELTLFVTLSTWLILQSELILIFHEFNYMRRGIRIILLTKEKAFPKTFHNRFKTFENKYTGIISRWIWSNRLNSCLQPVGRKRNTKNNSSTTEWSMPATRAKQGSQFITQQAWWWLWCTTFLFSCMRIIRKTIWWWCW